MNPESCPQLYTCSKVRMTPMIRVLLRCTAAEAMQSICNNCDGEQVGSRKHIKVSAYDEKDCTYVAPSGQKVTVMVGGNSGEEDTAHDCADR